MVSFVALVPVLGDSGKVSAAALGFAKRGGAASGQPPTSLPRTCPQRLREVADHPKHRASRPSQSSTQSGCQGPGGRQLQLRLRSAGRLGELPSEHPKGRARPSANGQGVHGHSSQPAAGRCRGSAGRHQPAGHPGDGTGRDSRVLGIDTTAPPVDRCTKPGSEQRRSAGKVSPIRADGVLDVRQLTGQVAGMPPQFGGAFGFVAAPLEQVSDEFVAWHTELGFGPRRSSLEAGLEQPPQNCCRSRRPHTPAVASRALVTSGRRISTPRRAGAIPAER